MICSAAIGSKCAGWPAASSNSESRSAWRRRSTAPSRTSWPFTKTARSAEHAASAEFRTLLIRPEGSAMDIRRSTEESPASRPMSGLTIRGVSAIVIEVPMRFPLGTSAATVRAAPLLLVDLDHRGGDHRPHLFVLLSDQRGESHRSLARRRGRTRARPTGGARRDRAIACASLRAARRDRHRAHGTGGAGRRSLGRVGASRRSASCDIVRCRAAADSEPTIPADWD